MLPQLPLSIQSAASALLEWLDQQTLINSHNETTPSNALRARVQVHPGHNAPLSWLRANACSQRLFFRSREQSFEVAALGFAHIASGSVFTQEVHSSLIAILNPAHPDMRFYGACRFDSSPNTRRDEEWNPYNGFTFVLPAVELFRDQDAQFYLAVNYYPPSDPDLLRGLLHGLVDAPLSLQTIDASFMIPRAQNIVDMTSFATWDSAMSNILRQLSSNQYDKIVLARRKRFSFSSSAPPDPVHVIAALDEQNRQKSCLYVNPVSGQKKLLKEELEAEATKSSYLFCLQLNRKTAFVGCTPERLFHLKDDEIRTEALAGTVKRSASSNEVDMLSELLSQKNLEEHRFVVDYIRTALSDSGVSVETNGPHIRRLPRLMHLATDVRGNCSGVSKYQEGSQNLERTERAPSVFRALETMHPTPAVCGMPRERTWKELQELEDFDRGFFAGPLGWFTSYSGEFCVAIRSALIHESNITAFAGSGIVQGSESKSEWEETELKMSAFTDLFSLPSKRNTTTSSNPILNGFHEHPIPSPRNRVRRHMDDVHDQDAPIANGKCFKRDFSSLNASTCSSISTANASVQLSENEVSRSPSMSSVGSQRPLVTSAFSRHDGRSNGYFDPSLIENAPNLNALWGCSCIEELCRNGVRTFFVAPGSRSAPLAVGVMRSPHAQMYVSHDERGAGFLAVGYARATRRAAAVITSSGTAVANLLPAVVEASVDALPLVLLTADRPPELRDIGANQAIYQYGIFGEYVRWSKDVPCPCGEIPLRNLLSDVDHAVHMTGSSPLFEGHSHAFRGPVHLNMMFREKLAPDHQSWDRSCLSSVPLKWKMSSAPLTTYYQKTMQSFSSYRGPGAKAYIHRHMSKEKHIFDTLRSMKRGVILVSGGSGSVQTENDGLAIYEIARILGWPIVADICSGLRFDGSSDNVVHYADQIFCSDVAFETLRPSAVMQFGERITSKRISNLIESASRTFEDFVHVLVSSSAKRADAVFTVTHRVIGDISGVLRDVQETGRVESERFCMQENGRGTDELNLKQLLNISKRIDHILRSMLAADENERLSEPWCARVLSESLIRPSALFIGNSMPIRDLDAFASYKENGLGIKVAANRGASGIDGIISSGIGFGIGMNMDVTIILGDMSMIHDMNALHLLRPGVDGMRIRVTVVVVNNQGGGIFSMLPIAQHREVFSPVFDTPHTVKFGKVSETFGIEYHTASTPRELRKVLRRPHERHRVIEALVAEDHDGNAELHRHLSANISQHVNAALADKC